MVRIFKSMELIMAVAAVCLMCFSCGNGNIGNESDNYSKPTGSLNGHDYVDLGLPSGTLWATCNVGANKPEEKGTFFAWGETTPKETYKESTYKYSNGKYHEFTKYCYNKYHGYNYYTDNRTVLEPSDDAATANWGSDWRMPTSDEMCELDNNCTKTWTTLNGVYGLLFTSPNGNCIFLPEAGIKHEDYTGGVGWYWSSTLDDHSTEYGKCLFFDIDVNKYGNKFLRSNFLIYHRAHGLSVRPVCSK